MQKKMGLGYCTGCQYFEANWSLPDLNDSHQTDRDCEENVRARARAIKQSKQ
jgi:hypothetical protein